MGGTVSFLSNLFQDKEYNILLIGLDGAGKTTILYQLKLNENINTISTIGFNVETIKFKGLNLKTWDLGGQHKLRQLWNKYYDDAHAIIYVLDAADIDRINETGRELRRLVLENDILKSCIFLILANKQDLPNALKSNEIMEQYSTFLELKHEKIRWNIQECCATKGEGIEQGLTWLAYRLKDLYIKENKNQLTNMGTNIMNKITFYCKEKWYQMKPEIFHNT